MGVSINQSGFVSKYRTLRNRIDPNKAMLPQET